jgi:hypothetical protein
MEKQLSSGGVRMKQIRATYNSYARSAREAAGKKLRLEKLISAFPKKERPLYEEQLEKYKTKMDGKA